MKCIYRIIYTKLWQS